MYRAASQLEPVVKLAQDLEKTTAVGTLLDQPNPLVKLVSLSIILIQESGSFVFTLSLLFLCAGRK